MKDGIYVVIDTNVIVSAVMARSAHSPTVGVLNYIFSHGIIPVFNQEIIEEYREVLSRPKFHFDQSVMNELISNIQSLGINMDRTPYLHDLPDPKDRVFYEVSLTGDSYLVTGNIKNFPVTPKVVTPAEMIAIIEGDSSSSMT